MNNRKFKLSLYLVAMLLVLSTLLCACNSKSDDKELGEEQGSLANVDITLFKDGLSQFDIIIPENATEEEEKAANLLKERLKSTAKDSDPAIKNADKHVADKVEILIGNTGYPESETIYNELGYGEFTVKVVGYKLVIASRFEEYLSEAIFELYTHVRMQYKDGSLVMKADTDITMVHSPNINAIPIYQDGNFEYTQEVGTLSNTTANQITFNQTTQEAFDAYKKVLADEGFEVIQTNTIGKNDFITVSNGKKLITAYHLGLLGQTRIIAENDRDFAHPDTADYNSVNDTTLWQLGLQWERENDLVYRMNAYVIKLADGRFILHDTGTRAAAPYIYDYLRQNTPAGEKIKVAAVIISHPHTDHMYGLLDMAKLYTKDQIEIEAAYFNFGAKSMQNNYTPARLGELIKECETAAETFGAKCYVARTGMKLQISNATVEFMWTADDNGTTIIEEYNDASIVTRITVNNQKMLFLGDHTEDPSIISMSMYQEELKSDIVTVAHHGMSGAEIEFYELVQPSIVFWPNRWYEEDYSRNEKLRKMECVKKHYLAGDGDVEITLQTK